MSALQTIWFFLVGVLLIGYALLDGFDLGTGYWYLRAKKKEHRSMMLAAIGPVWDGNEVWLITAGGALFAAFPPVYASVFSGFYLALILVLFGLILRATSIEFRGQVDSDRWRKWWDLAFGVGSLLPALLLGVALGDIVRGLPLDAHGDYTGTFFGLLHPFGLYCGVYGLVAFVIHGGLYQLMKLEGEAAEAIKAQLYRWWQAYLGMFVLLGVMVGVFAPVLFRNYLLFPLLFLVPSLILVSIILIWIYLRQNRIRAAFYASSGALASTLLTVGTMMYPRLVHATDPALNLTIRNSSSSQLTLTVMLIIALVGMPIVLGYNVWIYKTFAGKVKAGGDYH